MTKKPIRAERNTVIPCFIKMIKGAELMKKEMKGMLIIAMVLTAGCSSKSAVQSNDAGQKASSSSAVGSESSTLPTARTGYGFDKWQTGPLGDLFFEFDSSVLSSDAKDQLKQNSAWLTANSAKGVLIEGHCDSRGTSEYNLALGERRAASAKEYIVKLGVAASRLESVSFGSERPFDTGKNEEAWAKNRRAHFVVK